MTDTIPTIQKVLADHAGLGTDVKSLGPDEDLYEAGMTSRTTVSIMLALEDAFEIEFPDSMLRRDVFESISSIAEVVETILQD